MTCQELPDAYELYALGVLEGEEKAQGGAGTPLVYLYSG